VAVDDSRNMRLVSQSFNPFSSNVLLHELYRVNGPSVLANDIDHVSDTLSDPSFGTGGQGEITQVHADGSMLYERQALFNAFGLPPFTGQEQVTYVTSDGLVVSNSATVTLTAVANNSPVAVNDSYTVLRNSVLDVSLAVLGVIGGFVPLPPAGGIGNVAGADTDADNDPLTATLVTAPAHEHSTFNPMAASRTRRTQVSLAMTVFNIKSPMASWAARATSPRSRSTSLVRIPIRMAFSTRTRSKGPTAAMPTTTASQTARSQTWSRCPMPPTVAL
jgi:hypothetical protein